MKITEVVANFPPYFGGIGNACLEYSVQLLRHGNDVEVFTSNYPKRSYKYPKKLNVFRLKHQFKYGNAPLMLGLFKIKKTDIIHLHYPFYFGAEIVLLLSKFRKVKYVVTYHMDMVGRGPTKYIFALHRRLFLGLILKNSERIFVTSNDYAQHSDLVKVKNVDSKIVEVSLGVDLVRFKPATKNKKLLDKYHIPLSAPVLLFVGGLDQPHYFKGVTILLKAFKTVYPRAHLVIVGDGELRTSYMNTATELGISARVHFAGRVSDNDLPAYYSICDVFTLPSTDKVEAFGMVLLEAMASGKAVIASNLPGVRSLVEVNQNGLVTKPSNSQDLSDNLDKLLRDPAKCRKWGKRSRLIAEEYYSWQSAGKKLNSELQQVVADV